MTTDDESLVDDLGFTYQVRKSGEIAISRDGRVVATLGGPKAERLRADLEGADAAAVQQLLARVTGNYKRGNERLAGRHPRNQG